LQFSYLNNIEIFEFFIEYKMILHFCEDIEKDFTKIEHKQAQTTTPNLQNKYVRVKNSFDVAL